MEEIWSDEHLGEINSIVLYHIERKQSINMSALYDHVKKYSVRGDHVWASISEIQLLEALSVLLDRELITAINATNMAVYQSTYEEM